MARRKDIEEQTIKTFKAPREDVLLVLYDELPIQVMLGSGILLPGDLGAKTKVERVGTVVSVGVKIRTLKVGDRVLMDKRYGITLPHEHMEACRLIMVSEDQVEAVLTGDDADKDYDISLEGLKI